MRFTMKKLTLIACALALPFIATGCASVIQGTSQTLFFKLDPKEAKCVLTRTGDGELGSVSSSFNTLLIHKDKDDIFVQCSAPGYSPKTTKIVSGATTAGVTGIMLDYGITDMITGAMFAYPTEITIVMEKESPAAIQPSAALDSFNAVTEAAKNENQFQKLRALQTLRKDGVITDDEFQKKKLQLLEKL